MIEDSLKDIAALSDDKTLKQSVLFIAPQPFFAIRGSSFRIRSTVKALSELGYRVDLLVFGLGTDISILGVRILRAIKIPGVKKVPIGPSWIKFVLDLCLFFSALRLISRKRYSVVHGIEEGGMIAAVCGWISKTPYIFDMHSCMSESIRDLRRRFSPLLAKIVASLELLCLRKAAAVMTVGSAHSADVSRRAINTAVFAVEDTAAEIPQQVDLREISAVREQFKLQGSRVLLYTGNFAAYQGVELLLKAFAQFKSQVKEEDSAVRLLVVGGGPEEENQLQKYKCFSTESGLDNDTCFVGQKTAHEIPAFMAASDVLISPRITGQNTPLKVYSFMAAKRAIVATNIRSHTQVLNERNCYLCEPTPTSLADAIARALDNSPQAAEHRKKLIEQASNDFDERYSMRCFCAKIKSLYDCALGAGAA